MIFLDLVTLSGRDGFIFLPDRLFQYREWTGSAGREMGRGVK